MYGLYIWTIYIYNSLDYLFCGCHCFVPPMYIIKKFAVIIANEY